MTAPRHTPGPWALEEIDSDTGNFKHLVPAAEIDGERVSLLTIVEHNGQHFATVYSKNDARLIAAAPELLEALQRIADADHEEKFAALDMKVIARAAIAKATGGAA